MRALMDGLGRASHVDRQGLLMRGARAAQLGLLGTLLLIGGATAQGQTQTLAALPDASAAIERGGSATLSRDGKEQTVHARLSELNLGKENGSGTNVGEAHGGQLGIAVEPLNSELAGRLGLQRGTQGLAVTSVEAGGPAGEAGLRTDDVILEANHRVVKSVEELRSAVHEAGSKPVLLLVSRGGRNIFVAVTPR